MVKIIGIFAIVLVYYCEINAEVDHLQNRKTTREDVQKRFPTKKPPLAADIIKSHRTNEVQRRAKFATGFPEDFGGPLLKFVIKIGEAPYNDLGKLLVEARRANQIYRDEEKNQIGKNDSENNKPKMKKKLYHRSEKREDIDYKDDTHQIDKKRDKTVEENKEQESESTKPKKKKKYHHHSKKRQDINNENRKHQKDKKRDKPSQENEEKESESNNPKKKKRHNHHSVKGKNMKEVDYKDRKHPKDIERGKAVKENEEKVREINEPEDMKDVDNKDKKDEKNTTQDKAVKENEEKEREINEPEDMKEVDYKDKKDEMTQIKAVKENEEEYSESNELKKKKKHHHHSMKRERTKQVDYKNREHEKKKKRDKAVEENEKKESESNEPKTKKKKHHHNSEKREDMKEVDYKDSHREIKGKTSQKGKNRDKAVDENEKKESESNEPKKKKKHRHHSEKLEDMKEVDYKDRHREIEEKTNQKDKKRGKEPVIRNKFRNSLEKDDKYTEKSINRENDISTRKITRVWPYQSKSQEVNNLTEETAAEKEDGMLANVGAAALQVHSLAMASNEDLQLQPDSSKQVLPSTTTPKLQPKPVQEGDRTKYKNIVGHRTHKKKHARERATRMVPLALNKLYNKEEKQLQEDFARQGEDRKEKKREKHKNPSHLSPYAIIAQMEELMNEFPKVNATIKKFARTVEYNDIVLVTVTDNKESEGTYLRAKESKYAEDVPEKKIIFIVHGLTVMGMKGLTSLVQMSELKLLLSYYFKHLDKFDIYLMPLANPDGYSASRSSDRTIWNKNVSPQSECPGVFVDRNFDVAWNGTRETSSCSQLYPGAKPFSEVESKAVRDVFHHYSHKILAYIHVHSGTFDEKVFKGDAILYPRGYTEMQSDDDKYIDLKGEIDEAMKNASFRVISVTVDTLASWYGVVAGSSVDYASAVFGIPYALEFVMQIYDTAKLNNNALTEIWRRLIDTTFNNMWKSLHRASAERSEITLK